MNSDQIYVIAGEMSGDLLGGKLIAALRKLSQRPYIFAGIGGPSMQQVGVQSLFPMRDLSLMGFAEILPKLPKLLARIKQCVDDIVKRQPAVVITIDSPGFNFRVVKKARKLCPNTKFIHYVSPSVWAWKPERAEKMSHLFDGVMCLLPFEPQYYTPHGLRAAFVGHPAVELQDQVTEDPTSFYEKYDISLTNPPTILTLLFGSREGEVNRLGPALFEAAYRLLREWPNLTVLVPAPTHLWPLLKPLIGSDQRFIAVDPDDRFQAFSLSNAAIAASGTVGLELAMLGVPHTVAYKFAPLTYMIGKRIVKVPYMHLVNIMLGQKIVPEFLQGEATGANIANTALDILINRSGVADAQRQAFGQVYAALKGEGGGRPAEQAAAFVLGYIY